MAVIIKFAYFSDEDAVFTARKQPNEKRLKNPLNGDKVIFKCTSALAQKFLKTLCRRAKTSNLYSKLYFLVLCMDLKENRKNRHIHEKS